MAMSGQDLTAGHPVWHTIAPLVKSRKSVLCRKCEFTLLHRSDSQSFVFSQSDGVKNESLASHGNVIRTDVNIGADYWPKGGKYHSNI